MIIIIKLYLLYLGITKFAKAIKNENNRTINLNCKYHRFIINK